MPSQIGFVFCVGDVGFESQQLECVKESHITAIKDYVYIQIIFWIQKVDIWQ